MDSPPKEETPNIELPHDFNKLFDVDDDVGTYTIAHFSVSSEDEEEDVNSNNVWEHAIDILFKLTPLQKSSENGSNIKSWMMWNSFTNGMRNI